MIVVTVTTDNDGILCGVSATGHSTAFSAGDNIVCAAATVLLRTTFRLFEADSGVSAKGGAGERGELNLAVKALKKEKIAYIQAVGDFLIQGIADLQREFPAECSLTVDKQ